jgi:hypothetical protein
MNHEKFEIKILFVITFTVNIGLFSMSNKHFHEVYTEFSLVCLLGYEFLLWGIFVISHNYMKEML